MTNDEILMKLSDVYAAAKRIGDTLVNTDNRINAATFIDLITDVVAIQDNVISLQNHFCEKE